ncbi:MAG: PEP-CTERM sorting domain-containing protein [Myxococcota bacterium]
MVPVLSSSRPLRRLALRRVWTASAALVVAVGLVPLGAQAQSPPPISSANLVLQLRADVASVAVDAQGDVLSWTAANDPAIVLTRDPGFTPDEIRFEPAGAFGQPTVRVSDFGGNPHLDATLPGSIQLSDATILWLGFYRNSTSGSETLYTIGNGAGGGTYSHQQNAGVIEVDDGSTVYSGGDTALPYRGVPTVFATQYAGGTPVANHVVRADGIDLGVASSPIGYDGTPDPHPISLFAFDGSGRNFEGDLTELLVYDGLLTPSELADVEAYLRARVGAPPEIDLSTGQVVQYEFGCRPDADWVIDANGRTLDQTVQSDASIFLTGQESSDHVITGRLASGLAPNFIGFVFGYQDRHRYYVFDWKRVSADWCGGFAERGMRLRRFAYPPGVDPEGREMWADANPNVTLLARNTIPWAIDVDYTFELDFADGQIEIAIREPDGTLLEQFSVTDTTYADGPFGLFVHRQDDIVFGPFNAVPEPGFGWALGAGGLGLALSRRRRRTH